VNLKKSNNWKL